LVEVARLRLGLASGEPAEIRPFYPEAIDAFWIVPLFAGDHGRVVVLKVRDGAVEPHAGLPRAAARLRDADLLARDLSFAAANIRPILDAVGGLTPGSPRYPSETTEQQVDGGIRLVFEEPEPWVRFAASGGLGAPPPEGVGSGGFRPPEPLGRMECTLSSDYRVAWTYAVEAGAIGSFAGDAANDQPDRLDGLLAEKVVAAARLQLGSPLAVPAAPVRPLDDDQPGGGWQVDFLGLGAVAVYPPLEV
jgi:hypothetical protein